MGVEDSGHLSALERRLLRRAIHLSASASAKGNMAFGALLADPEGNILLEAENTTFTNGIPSTTPRPTSSTRQ
ncbi:MAG: hypothetical protein OXN80_07520 [bacterium]|nr:hypothetical protein [bacterium]